RRAVKGRLARLILTGGNDRLNMVPAQPLPDAGVAVALVPRDSLGPARAARPPRAFGPEHHGRKGLRFMPLAGGDPHGQHGAVPLADEVDLSAEAPLRAAQGMVRRL